MEEGPAMRLRACIALLLYLEALDKTLKVIVMDWC